MSWCTSSLTAFCSAAFCSACLALSAQDQSGSIGGMVIDAVTHQPVKKATVQIVLSTPQNPAVAAITSDATGAFTLTGLAPGKYWLMAVHSSYPQAGQKRAVVEVKAGEGSSVNLELIPGASISGRVLDEDGDPLPGCFVMPHPANHPGQAVSTQGGASPNENGEYRVYGFPGGKYTISARCPTPVFRPRPLSSGPDPPPASAYPVQFYPLALDAKSAQVIEVAPGSEKSGVDFRMRPAPVTQIHGKFSPAGADWHSAPIGGAQLIPLDATGMSADAIVDPDKGSFEFAQVFPGSYTLVIQSSQQENPIGAFQRVEVKDRPLALVIELHHAVDISGTVEIDGDKPVALNQIGVRLLPDGYPVQQVPQARVKEDGTFTLSSIVPGRWWLGANAPTAYLKSVWLGSENVTRRPLDFSSAAAGPLRIVLGTNGGALQGTGPAGYDLYVESSDPNHAGRTNFGLNIDARGRFSVAFIAPGKYRVVAYEPGLVPEDGGQEIVIHEGETITVDLKP